MDKRNKIFISCWLVFCLGSTICYSQILTLNDGFEGIPIQAEPPSPWNNCNDGSSSVDTQPGYFNNYVFPSQGRTYISLVTRDIGTPGTVETVWADLLTPFQINKKVELSIDLSLSYDFEGSFDFYDYSFTSPCVLQVIGFNGDCSAPQQSELLWQSEVLTNYSWLTFHVEVIPTVATFSNLAIRPFFSIADYWTNSAVLVDNLRLGHWPPVIHVPTVFTPNGDGINEDFYVADISISQFDLRVYNRWGDVVFATRNKSEAWNGQSKSMDCSAGAYYYVVNATFFDGKSVMQNGYVTLLR